MSNDIQLHGENLQETLSRLQDRVRNEPANAKHRIFLFQLLAILGDWNRALNQLNVLKEMSPETIPMVVTYREAIRCEMLRAEIFAGQRSPVVFGEPESWTALLLESLRLTADENYSQAEELRAQAFEAAPAIAGIINGHSFDWIADADCRLGPIIEVIVDGRYVWVPFHRVRRIDIEEPADLRDSVWMPAHFIWSNGGELVGLIPTRYPGTETSEDDQLKLSRKTAWIEAGVDTFLGQGQKMFTTDAEEYGIMDIRQVDLETAADSDGAGSDMDSSHA
ncbi:MAG: type VI secretion system accessory protein TagJ [bacterium]